MPKVKDDWRTLNKALPKMSESEVFALFEAEKRGKRRRVHLIRLHQRYTALRSARERMEFI